MSCHYPMDAWMSRRLTEKGKRRPVFRRGDGYEDMQLQLPCGKCVGCRADQALAWSIRCYHEASLYPQNSFLTLTYADPPPDKLDKVHLQKFIRALRDDGVKFRYFACGEYGDATKRPHYHASVFGQDFLGKSAKVSEGYYVSDYLQSKWGYGHIQVAPFNMQTACYVAGYVGKKIGQEDDGFKLQSNGLGFDWLARHWPEVRANGFVVIEGRKLPVPAAYLRRAEEKLGNVLDVVKAQRKARFDDMDIEKKIDLRREAAAKEVYAQQKIQHQKEKQKL